SLLKPNLKSFQGPALLLRNTTIFKEEDLKSLENLANSEKRSQYDKIGEKGIRFTSIYHLCDSCSFITNDKFIILDPHNWCYERGGVKHNFVEENLAQICEDQFSPFKKLGIPYSEISSRTYKPDDILQMFDRFFVNKNDNCLLFLRHIESIKFYELKEAKAKPELLYEISISNAENVRKVKEIGLGKNHKIKKLNRNSTCYQADFSQMKEEISERIPAVPYVGLAVRLNSGQNTDEFWGRIFNFLPLPIKTPFHVFIHGQFAVINNRRTLLSDDNNDLFRSYIPVDVSQDDYYKFWPIPNKAQIMSSSFFRDLLKNIIYIICKFYKNEEVFYGPDQMLSISTGYFQDKSFESAIQNILAKIGFPVIYAPVEIMNKLKSSDKEIKSYSPLCISEFLRENKVKLQNKLTNNEILELLNYLLLIDRKNQNFNIEVINAHVIASIVKNSLSDFDSIEIYMKSLSSGLFDFGSIYAIKTQSGSNEIFLNRPEGVYKDLVPILKNLGIVFVVIEFENNLTSWKSNRISTYICDINDITSVLLSLKPNGACHLDSNEADKFIDYLYNLRNINPYFKDHVEVIKRLPIFKEFKEIGQYNMIDLESNIKNFFLLPHNYQLIITTSKTFRFLNKSSEAMCYLLEDVINIRRLTQNEYWINLVILCLKYQQNIDIVTVEKLVEQLPTLFESDHSLKNKLSKITFIPSGTIRMAQGKEDLDTIKCMPVNLFDSTNQEIAQLFFDDEKVFPVGKFSDACNQHYHILKELGMKTSLTKIDIVKRINKYVEPREGNKNDLRDKSLNLFRYFDEH
ncbi:7455_t:CDS:2, partial [Gigaspora rosea]